MNEDCSEETEEFPPLTKSVKKELFICNLAFIGVLILFIVCYIDICYINIITYFWRNLQDFHNYFRNC